MRQVKCPKCGKQGRWLPMYGLHGHRQRGQFSVVHEVADGTTNSHSFEAGEVITSCGPFTERDLEASKEDTRNMIIDTPDKDIIIPDDVARYLANAIQEVGPQHVRVIAREGQQLYGGPTRYIWEVVMTFPWQEEEGA